MDDMTDSEKINWLWDKRNDDHARIAALEALIVSLEGEIKVRDDELVRLQHRVAEANETLFSMAKELNQARASAASAVHDYIGGQYAQEALDV